MYAISFVKSIAVALREHGPGGKVSIEDLS